MLVVRPISNNDLDQLYELSDLAEAGLTSLPHDLEILKRKIKDSIRSFSEVSEKPSGEVYLFVIEDTQKKKVVGTTAIYAKVGGFEPFYTYKIKQTHKESGALKIKKDIYYLEVLSNHNGPSEIGTLFLAPEYRKNGNGRLLSLSRFLFMAQYRQCFEPEVVAEMRGVINDNDQSPFWEALGKHFFGVEFRNADMMVLRDKSFIADLMPEYPIYIAMLPKNAQEVIGKVHHNTEPALHLLQKEGFIYKDEIDIFEAGPVVKAKVQEIRTVKESQETILKEIVPEIADKTQYLIANVGSFQDFRVIIGQIERIEEGIRITAEAAELLKAAVSGAFRYCLLKPEKSL